MNQSDSTVWANASRLLDDSKVIARIDYLKNHLAEAAGTPAFVDKWMRAGASIRILLRRCSCWPTDGWQIWASCV